MLTQKCDRCGHLAPVTALDTFHEGYSLVDMLWKKNESHGGPEKGTWDLCWECTLQLKEFMGISREGEGNTRHDGCLTIIVTGRGRIDSCTLRQGHAGAHTPPGVEYASDGEDTLAQARESCQHAFMHDSLICKYCGEYVGNTGPELCGDKVSYDDGTVEYCIKPKGHMDLHTANPRYLDTQNTGPEIPKFLGDPFDQAERHAYDEVAEQAGKLEGSINAYHFYANVAYRADELRQEYAAEMGKGRTTETGKSYD